MSALGAFADALVAPPEAAEGAPDGVVTPTGAPAPRRFAVYRNNRVSTLVEALAGNFPLCRVLVGERFFDAMALVYTDRHPPRSPLLFRFGDAFAAFAAGFEPARSVPYLADLARLEWAWLEAHHAADAPALPASVLAAVPVDALGALRLHLHPAVALVRSPFPVVTIAARLRADRDLAGLDMARGEDALVTRPELDVELRALPPGGFEFIEALARHPLGEAAERGATVSGFDLAANIAGLFAAGGVAATQPDTNTTETT